MRITCVAFMKLDSCSIAQTLGLITTLTYSSSISWLLSFYLVGDFDKIWREHCEDEETLCEYAEAMKNLADNHWTKTCEGEGRIEWCCR